MKEPLQYHLNKNVIVVAVGPSTMKAIEENYVHVDVMPDIYKMGAMIKSLSDYLGQANTPKKKRADVKLYFPPLESFNYQIK